jgi:hypothetical protein
MQAIWEGAPPASLFRSWYSIFPPNKSLFKVWILVAFLMTFTLGWMYLSLLFFPHSWFGQS